LELNAKVPGATEAQVKKAAEDAKAGCPIPRLLKASIPSLLLPSPRSPFSLTPIPTPTILFPLTVHIYYTEPKGGQIKQYCIYFIKMQIIWEGFTDPLIKFIYYESSGG
jgi:hypothetical protein